MRGLLHHRSWFAQALAAFALVAMAVRALVPAGYMFTAEHEGRFITVTLCSAQGAADAVIDLTSGRVLAPHEAPADEAPEKPPHVDAPCVFATVAALSQPEQTPALLAAFRIAAAVHPFSAQVSPGRGLAAPPPWSTGPPLTL
ncbi:MAG: hypothetical protein R3C27_11710 [Hyphomonadaceae bacterium]